jgi:hypothetical protein
MKLNYPEKGGLKAGGQKYAEGAEITHPSGAVYRRIDGNWVCIRKPGQ